MGDSLSSRFITLTAFIAARDIMESRLLFDKSEPRLLFSP